jgi:hypothetical protein
MKNAVLFVEHIMEIGVLREPTSVASTHSVRVGVLLIVCCVIKVFGLMTRGTWLIWDVMESCVMTVDLVLLVRHVPWFQAK